MRTSRPPTLSRSTRAGSRRSSGWSASKRSNLVAILDAWLRKVVGYATSRSMDARIAVAALKAAIRNRAPPKGCIHHSDRGSQYASEVYRTLLAAHGLTGSMSRRGNPYDNAKAESFMKTLKVEAVYLAAYETFEGRHRRPSTLHRRRLQLTPAALGTRLSQPRAVRGSTRPADGQNSGLILSTRRGALKNLETLACCVTGMRLRVVPQLSFQPDKAIEYATHVEVLLNAPEVARDWLRTAIGATVP